MTVERQQRILMALTDRGLDKLAGVYKSALTTLQAAPQAGSDHARVSIICHCMRELMTGLPPAMADGIVERPKPSSGSLTGKLPNLLSDHPELDLNLDQDVIPVPKPVAHAVAEIVSAATKEQGRNRANAAALVTKGSDTQHPVVDQWMGTYQFFVGWAHLDRNHEGGRQLPADDEILVAMRVVEDVIEVFTTVFFENVRALDDLLSEINAPNEEGG